MTLRDSRAFVLQILLLLFGVVGISLAWVYTGADLWLAKWVMAEEGSAAWTWAWWMRQYATQPAVWVSLGAFLYLLTPFQQRQPLLRQLAAVWLVVLVFGSGLINQVILQEVVDRARPRDVFAFLEGSQTAMLSGHSFPSGHAAMGFVFLAPFFVLKSRLRWVFLLGGIGWGMTVGAARMVVGAHYVTDVIWAGILCAVTAWVAVRVLPYGKRIYRWILLVILALGVVGIVLGNKFTLTLRWEGDAAVAVDLNCPALLLPNGEAQRMEVVYTLTGYGAPLSNLHLVERDGVLRLQRWRGVYHSLTCEKIAINGLAALDSGMKSP